MTEIKLRPLPVHRRGWELTRKYDELWSSLALEANRMFAITSFPSRRYYEHEL